MQPRVGYFFRILISLVICAINVVIISDQVHYLQDSVTFGMAITPIMENYVCSYVLFPVLFLFMLFLLRKVPNINVTASIFLLQALSILIIGLYEVRNPNLEAIGNTELSLSYYSSPTKFMMYVASALSFGAAVWFYMKRRRRLN